MVSNLIENAIKFTPKGGHVTVSVAILEAPLRAVVSVKDTGVGITKVTEIVMPQYSFQFTLSGEYQ